MPNKETTTDNSRPLVFKGYADIRGEDIFIARF
jgi:hypothetical protein